MIRPMRWWDLAQVHQIEVEAFGPDAWSLEQLWAELARVPESRWYVVATADAGPVAGRGESRHAPTSADGPVTAGEPGHPAGPPAPDTARGAALAGAVPITPASEPILGYAGLFVAGDAADIQTVAIAPVARRSGIGRALVAALIGHARELGLGSLHLEVAAGNEAAYRLYQSAGFARVGRRRDYYGPGRDAELMTLALA